MALVTFKSDDKNLMLLQSNWTAQLNPIIANPLTDPTILTNVSLATGVNVINHLLGKTQQGWFITDINAVVSIYRSAPFNNLTLTLTSSAPCTVSLGVF